MYEKHNFLSAFFKEDPAPEEAFFPLIL